MIRDRAHLSELIAWLEGAGVDRAFVVGGDAKEPGAYPDGLSLLRAMAEIGHPLAEIGIPAYPQGHAFIADGPILEALRAKVPFASYMTTQLCFDPGAICGVARRPARRRHHAAGPSRPARCRGAAAPARHQRTDRGCRHAPLSGQEHALHRSPDPVRRLLPAGRVARRAGAAHRQPDEPDRRPAPLHVQRRRCHRGVAVGVPRSAAGPGRRLTHGSARLAHPGGVGHHVPTTEERLIKSGGGTGPLKPRQPTDAEPARCQVRAGPPAR